MTEFRQAKVKALEFLRSYVAIQSRIPTLDGRNRAVVIAESLARVSAAIRIASVRWSSYHPLKTQDLVLIAPAFVVLRFESRDWRSLV